MKYIQMLDAINIVRKLQENDFEAYLVGGCVRDIIMNRMPNDIDITTSAKPEEIEEIFKTTIPTGIKHGTVAVLTKNGVYEVTTFRIDGEYSDGRHPDFVRYTSDITEDLSRRDFTMNAIAYNPTTGEVIDPFNGKSDIENKTIRCVGDANKRFEEDSLRIIRAVRFSATLNFEIEENTLTAMNLNKDRIIFSSKERIMKELSKIFLSKHPHYLMHYQEVLCTIIPEFKKTINYNQNSAWHCYDLYNHMLYALKNSADDDLDIFCRIALFLHDIGKPDCMTIGADGYSHYKGHGAVSAEIAEKILTRLRFDSKTIKIVTELIKYHDVSIGIESKGVRRLLNKLGADQFERLMDIRLCDIKAQTEKQSETRIIKVLQLKNIAQKIINESNCFMLKDLAVNGFDVIELGYRGTEIGEILNYLLNKVIDDPSLNTKKDLINLARKDRGLEPI